MKQTELHTNKTLLRVILAAAAVLILCGAAIGAVGAATQVDTAEALIKEVASDNFDVILGADITLSNRLDISTTGKLDLGGHVLSRAHVSDNQPAIWVKDSGNLTLTDTHTDTDVHYFQISSDDGTKLKSPWVLANPSPEEIAANNIIPLEEIDSYDGEHGWAKQNNDDTYVYKYVKVTGGVIIGIDYAVSVMGTFTMLDGNIIGSDGKESGSPSAVLVTSSGRFEMSGGSIAGNCTGSGGGVSNNGIFTLSSGRIVGNTATTGDGGGGGVYGGGTFTISGGSIIGNSAYNGGGMMIVGYTGVTFTMSGGEITGNVAVKDEQNEHGDGGGMVVNAYGENITLSGGSITKNTAAGNGGGVAIWTPSMLTMSGGSITENTAAGNGGGVSITGNDTDSAFTMSGGSITKNTATDNGGGVYLIGGGNFNVSGSPSVSGNMKSGAANDVHLDSNKYITVTGPLSGADIGIASPLNGKFGQAGEDPATYERYPIKESDAACFFPDSGFLKAKVSGSNLEWDTTAPDVKVTYEGTAYDLTDDTRVTAFNTVLGSKATYVKDTNTLTLKDKLTLTKSFIVNVPKSGTPFTIDLNGQVLQADAAAATAEPFSVITVGEGAELVVKDSDIQKIPHFFSILDENFKLSNSWKLDENGFYTNVIDLAEIKSYDGEDGGWAYQTDGNYKYHNVSVPGGVITGGTGTKLSESGTKMGGGGVYVQPNGKFTLSGGNIVGNELKTTDVDEGGGVYINTNGKFTLSGGAIAGNSAKEGGGVGISGTFTMSGGEITGNSATKSSGGGVLLTSGAFTMTDGKIIGNITPPMSNGGGVYVNDGTFTMSGGEITGNRTLNLGGGVCVNDDKAATFKVMGAPVIKDNNRQSAADNVYLWSQKTTLLQLTGAFTGGEIWISYPPDSLPSEGDQFGTAEAGASGAEHFFADGTEFFGKIDDGKLVWMGSEPPIPPTKYTVTFDSAGGSEVDSQDVPEGETASKPENPTKDGFSFAKWLAADGTEYDFSTPVYSDITLTAKWVTKTPESEEVDELIGELVQNQGKEVVLAVNDMNERYIIAQLLQKAEEAGVKDRISIDPTAGNEEAFMELILGAEQGEYSPVNLETAKDTRKKVSELVAEETISKDIALLVKIDGSNIKTILEIIDACPSAAGSVQIPEKVRISEGTDITPTNNTKGVIINLLTKAANSATADNAHLTLKEGNEDAVKYIAGELPGVIVEVTEGNQGIVEKLIVGGTLITLTVDNGNKDAVFSIAEKHSYVCVEVTEENESTIREFLETGDVKLTLQMRQDGTNAAKVLSICEYYSGDAVAAVPNKIIFKTQTTIPVTVDSKDNLLLVLKAATKGESTNKITVDPGEYDFEHPEIYEKNLLIIANLLGDKDVAGHKVYTKMGELTNVYRVVVPSTEKIFFTPFSLHVREDAEKYVESVEILYEINAASLLITKVDGRVLGESTEIPQNVPASSGFTSQSVYTVFQTYGTVVDEGKPVTLRFDVKSKSGYGNGTENYYLKVYNTETGRWESDHIQMTGKPEKVEGEENTWRYTFTLNNFGDGKPGVYAFVYEVPVKKSSGGGGSSSWAPSPASQDPANPLDPANPSVDANIVSSDITASYAGSVFVPVTTSDISRIAETSQALAAQITASIEAAAADGLAITNSKGAKAIVNISENIPGVQKETFYEVIDMHSADGSKVTSVSFKVPLAEIAAKNLTTNDVTLYHFIEKHNIWIPLETAFVSQDDKFAYFRAATDGASPFGVLLKKTDMPEVKPITTQTPAPASPMPIMGILAGLGAAAVLFGLRRK